MPQIAILQSYEVQCDTYEGASEIVSQSISDWAYVTEEELDALRKYLNRSDSSTGGFYTVFIKVPSTAIPALVSECVELAVKAAEIKRDRAAKAKLAREKKVIENEEKKKRDQLAEFERLKKIFEDADS